MNMKGIAVGLLPWLQATKTEGFGGPKLQRKGEELWETQAGDWLALGLSLPALGPWVSLRKAERLLPSPVSHVRLQLGAFTVMGTRQKGMGRGWSQACGWGNFGEKQVN